MKIAVFCGATTPHNPQFALAARQLGELIASNGHSLLYGGSNLGLMGEVSGAALKNGGQVIGVIPNFFSERKEYLIAQSDAFIALPGGIGTLDETLEVMVANQLGLSQKPMGLLNTNNYYQNLIAMFLHMEKEGFYNLANAHYLFLEKEPELLLQRLTNFKPNPDKGPVAKRLRSKA